MRSFKQYLEYQATGVPAMQKEKSHSIVPPNQFDPDYRKFSNWEFNCLKNLWELIEISDNQVYSKKWSPIIKSADHKIWTAVTTTPSGDITNASSWNPKIFEMLKNRGIASSTPNERPVIDSRTQEEHPPNTLSEIYIDVLVSRLKDQSAAVKLRGMDTDLINRAWQQAGQQRLPAFHGTTIMTGY